MKPIKSLILVAVIAMAACSCEKKETEPDPIDNSGLVELKGTITENKTLSADNKYLLVGNVFVQAPATLTIEPGTIIKGDKDSKATLVIERGAKIMAIGTIEKPIVFTSNFPVGQRGYGNWGGIILLGNATENIDGTPIIEGGIDRAYGGNDDTDNSGTMKYVRIEFAGIALNPGNEINGLTMGGVGSGTTLDFIQVSYCGDDSFEWFGGTVNAKHLISFRAWDDDFDTDNGFKGKVQFGLVLRDPKIADESKSNGFESDNDSGGSDKTPRTSPVFSNISVFGPLNGVINPSDINSLYGSAMHLRRNTATSIFNSMLAGYPKGLLLDGDKCYANATSGELVIKNTILAGMTTLFDAPGTASYTKTDVQDWFLESVKENKTFSLADLMLNTNNFNLTSPGFVPQIGSPLLSGSDFTDSKLSGLTNVPFRGAFGTEDWTAGWANWDPQNTEY